MKKLQNKDDKNVEREISEEEEIFILCRYKVRSKVSILLFILLGFGIICYILSMALGELIWLIIGSIFIGITFLVIGWYRLYFGCWVKEVQ